MQIAPSHIFDYLTYTEDVIIASKFLPESSVSYPLRRRIVSYLSHIVTKVLFRLPFSDTQCGLKVFNRKVLDREWKSKGFGYDIEVLSVIAREDNLTLRELPVTVTEREKSSVSLKSCFKTLYELLWLKVALRPSRGSVCE